MADTLLNEILKSHQKSKSICVFGNNDDDNNNFLSFLKNGLNGINQLNKNTDTWNIFTSVPYGYKILSRESTNKADICILLISANDYKKFLNDEIEKYLTFIHNENIKNLIICYNFTNEMNWPVSINHEVVCHCCRLLQKYELDKFITCPISVKYGLNIFQKHNKSWAKSSLYSTLDTLSIQNGDYCVECFYNNKKD